MAITTTKNYHKNSESSETTVKSNAYSRSYNLNCSVTAKFPNRIIMTLRQNINIGICNGAAMEQAIWEDQKTGV